MNTQHPDPSSDVPDYAQDEPSLRPYFEAVWKRRWFIAQALAVVAALYVVGVVLLMVVSPTERLSTVRFRILFQGAAAGRYPNGIPFSPADIVSDAVLTDVYQANDLKQYGSYRSFKEAMYVQQSNLTLDLLTYEFQARLSDPKMTSVERGRVEEDFKRRRESIKDAAYSLSLRRSERFSTLPATMAQKVLTDSLDTWARRAQGMGALRYEVPVLSRAVISKDAFERDDYFVSADRLRTDAARVLAIIGQIDDVPGGVTIRTAKDKVTLAEIRTRIENALRFELEPVLGIIRSEGITKDARLLRLYAQNQMFQIQLDKAAAEGRAAAVKDALHDYMARSTAGSDARAGGQGGRTGGFDTPAMIPQFGESFLDRLIDLSTQTQTSDVEYRQQLTSRVIDASTAVVNADKELGYYKELVLALDRAGRGGPASAGLQATIRTRFDATFDAIATSTEQLATLYEELSAMNLNPASSLYAMTSPFSQSSVRPLRLRTVLLGFVLVMMLSSLALAAFVLVRQAMGARG